MKTRVRNIIKELCAGIMSGGLLALLNIPLYWSGVLTITTAPTLTYYLLPIVTLGTSANLGFASKPLSDLLTMLVKTLGFGVSLITINTLALTWSLLPQHAGPLKFILGYCGVCTLLYLFALSLTTGVKKFKRRRQAIRQQEESSNTQSTTHLTFRV